MPYGPNNPRPGSATFTDMVADTVAKVVDRYGDPGVPVYDVTAAGGDLHDVPAPPMDAAATRAAVEADAAEILARWAQEGSDADT